MRKKLFLGIIAGLNILLIVFAFQNVFVNQNFWLFFMRITTSSTVVILFSGLIGFLIGFFAMLYSYEVRKEKDSQEAAEIEAVAPAVRAEEKSEPTPEEKGKEEKETPPADDFDDDDEILG